MEKNNQRGFTLLELLISFAIVAFLLLGAAQLTLYSVYAKRVSDCSLESAELASDKLENLKSLSFESQELEEDSYTERIESQKRNDVFLRKWIIFDYPGDLKKIEMECYSISCVHRKTRLVLLYSRELGF
jgi:prepilin-type N-terminal cleavage/methylation domain-containing protein